MSKSSSTPQPPRHGRVIAGAPGAMTATHLRSLGCEVTVELLGCLGVLQSPLLAFASFGIHKSNLLETRVVIASYNPHVRLLSPELLWLVSAPPKSTRGIGADIVMESATLTVGILSAIGIYRLLDLAFWRAQNHFGSQLSSFTRKT